MQEITTNIKKYIQKINEFCQDTPLLGRLLDLFIYSAVILYDFIALNFIFKVLFAHVYTLSSISTIIFILALIAYSIYLLFKQRDYRQICLFFILMTFFF